MPKAAVAAEPVVARELGQGQLRAVELVVGPEQAQVALAPAGRPALQPAPDLRQAQALQVLRRHMTVPGT